MKLTDTVLRQRGMPPPDGAADKEGRGNVLVIAGSRELPGAALLAATASLRAGAGRLAIATPASVAVALGLAVPESRVIGLPETTSGGLDKAGIPALTPLSGRIDALLIGPGLVDEPTTTAFTQSVLEAFDCPVVLDALAMTAVAAGMRPRDALVLTPHAGEMAHLTGHAKDKVQDEAPALATEIAARWRAGIVLKGSTTHIAFPDEPCWHHDGGDVGLATSGSGDTLAGLLAGLLARGLTPLDAALWAVRVHAVAGDRLAARHGRWGYLARELGQEIPRAMHGLCVGMPQRGDTPSS